MPATHWTTLYHQAEWPLDALFVDPNFLLQYNQNALTLYMSGCPQLHLFVLIVVSIAPEDCKGICKALWRALYQDDWGHNGDCVVRHRSSTLRVQQVYQYSGITSLSVIRHNVPEPEYERPSAVGSVELGSSRHPAPQRPWPSRRTCSVPAACRRPLRCTLRMGDRSVSQATGAGARRSLSQVVAAAHMAAMLPAAQLPAAAATAV
jgi:hypothetical protein